MNTRPAYVQDMEGTEKVFLVEQTDFRGPDRSRMMNNIRDNIIENYGNPKLLAQRLKEMLDDEVGPQWHVVVGTDYAAFMSFSPGSYIQARYGDLTVLMYQLH
ncbi:putative dynein light chain 2 cytoplasmic [Taenia solium]|eukprot:TsM_000678100 transcript=TsM_000678100 gene=TsM_000678100